MPKFFNEKFFTFFKKHENKRILVLCGGANSGKSYSIIQWFITKLISETGKTFLLTRKTLPALRMTNGKLLLELLTAYDIPYRFNKTEMKINCQGNEIFLRAIDDPAKVKSFESNYVHIEEASEFTEHDFDQLNLRTRKINDKTNQLFLSLNPVEYETSWIHKRFYSREDPNAVTLHSTYRDNLRFLTPQYIQLLKDLKRKDRSFFDIYSEGKWAAQGERIYENWQLWPGKWPTEFDEIFYGLDFGFNSESALLEIGLRDKNVFEKELLYEKHFTNQDLILQLKELIPNKFSEIFADPAEPSRIEEIAGAGFNIHSALKGPGSIVAGISLVKNFITYLHPDSANLIKEKKAYKWRTNAKGEILDAPVKWMDHLLDAERGALYTHTRHEIQDFRALDEEEKPETASGGISREKMLALRYGE